LPTLQNSRDDCPKNIVAARNDHYFDWSRFLNWVYHWRVRHRRCANRFKDESSKQTRSAEESRQGSGGDYVRVVAAILG
jgi:hypothetical protein